MLEALGIAAGCRCLEVGAGGGSLVLLQIVFESLRDAVVDAGLPSREDADTAAARFAENRRVLTPMGMAGIDRY